MQLVGFLSFLVVATTAKSIVVENGAICENKATGFFVIDNTILNLTDSIIYKDTSEEDCLKTCSSNRDQFGRSILCSSMVYDHISFTCTIYKDKSKPEGSGIVAQAVGKRYFEKVCLTDEVPMECADAQFIRADDSVLVGYARNVTLVESMEQCIAQCVKEKCKSAMYFYEEGECITNTESALSKPRSFAKEENDKVIYFQNGCLSKQVTETNTSEELPATTPQPNATSGEETDSSEEKDEAVTPNTENKSEKSEDSEEAQISEEKEENHDNITTTPLITSSSKTTEPTPIDDENSEDDDDESEVTEANTVNIERVKSSEANPETEEKHSEDNEEYDEEASPEEEREENVDNEKLFGEKIEEANSSAEMIRKKGEKANYIKYKKHSRNLPSMISTTSETSTEKLKGTSEETAGLPVDSTSSIPITASSLEEENNNHLHHEDGEETSAGYAKTLKKKKILKIKSLISNLNDGENTSLEFPNYFSEWSDWTPCTKSGERQIRRRKCIDLRRCLGALMQVQNCPAVLPEQKSNTGPIESVRSVIGVPAIPEEYDDEQTESVQSLQLTSRLPPSPSTSPNQSIENVWSPWLGVCQQFASSQPCNNGEMIGFESRECISKDPSLCDGPFFRYCTLLC